MSSRALLLDENLSPRLVAKLAREFSGIAHVTQFNLLGMPDIEIWRFAGEQGYCVVSTDSDFNQLAFVHGAPPQVIWLRLGDATTDEIASYLLRHKRVIDQFIAQGASDVLEIP
jgi:predicted nuclease of predicted toxin-antitoxin system